jgi:hypothetical protein
MPHPSRLATLIPIHALTLGGLLVLASPAASAPAKAKKDPAAVLAVVSGGVTIHRAGATLDGSFGASLEPGDVVETGSDAQAAVLFDSGQIIELGPGSKISIGSLPAKDAGAGGPVLAQMPDAFSGGLARFAQSASDEAGISALPDLRGGASGDQPEPLSPRNTRVNAGTLGFRWSAVEDALEYRVHLKGPGGVTAMHPATGTTWTSETPFTAASRWTWSVEAVTPDGAVRSSEVAFEVASTDQAGELAQLKGRLEPLFGSKDRTREDTASYLLGSYCRSTGFYDEAIAQIEALVARNPERKELHRELGSLYQAIGRNDKAAQEYRQALEE